MQVNTVFNKREEFENQIEDKLAEVRRLCNRLRIPFVWVAAVGDDGGNTDYAVAVDENQDEDAPDKRYLCNGLTPGAMEITLSDDKIREVIKIMNGFKAVPKDTELTLSADDIKPVSSFLSNGFLQDDGAGAEDYFTSEDELMFKQEVESSNVSYKGISALGSDEDDD